MPGRRGLAISRRAVAGLVAAVLLLVAAAVGGFFEQRQAIRAGDWSLRTLEVLQQAKLVLARLTDAETGQRGFLLTGDEAYLAIYERAQTTLPGNLVKLRDLVSGDAEQAQRVARLEPMITAKMAELAETIALRRTRGEEAAIAAVRTDVGKAAMDAAREVLDAFQDEERRLLRERLALRADRSRRAGWLVLAAAFAALGFGTVAFVSIESESRRRRRAEAEARESEERLRTTLRSIGDGVIATDPHGMVVFMNPVAEVLTGWKQSAARGQPLHDVFRIVNEATRATVESPVTKVLREGKVVGLANHTMLLAKDGREIPIDDSGAPIRDGDGDIMGVVLVFRDVSDRKRAEQERERLSLSESANVAKDEFLAMLSHELRSPLHAMLGWVALLKKNALTGVQLERAIETIERNIQLQSQLVDDLLDVSRIVSGKLVLEEQPVALAPIVRASVENLRPAAGAKGLELTSAVDDIPGSVVGDRKRLEQVVTNLLTNAIKFTPRGGTVAVRLEARGGAACITVEDTGAGLAPGFLPHVFERFRQADASSTRAHGGLGLGLSIVRSLVELHRGRVSAESPGLGLGATFRVVLPLRELEPAAIGADGGKPGGLNGITVLLVDDEPDTREALWLILEMSGARVLAVGSAKEARTILERTRPDVIVSDIGMPDENGYQFLAAVRQLDGGDGMPAIALTGFVGKEDVDAASSAGFTAHVAKPVDPDSLIAKIRQVVRHDGSGATAGA